MIERHWYTFEADNGDVHVVPWEGSEDSGRIAPGHTPSPLCACGPKITHREGRDRVISHRQPDWPGANAEIVQ